MSSLGNYNTSGGPIKIKRDPNHDPSDLSAQKLKIETLLRNTSETKQKLKVKIVASRDRFNSSIDMSARPPRPAVNLN
jgi:hypothetical protein